MMRLASPGGFLPAPAEPPADVTPGMARTIWILGDQLSHRHTALAAADRDSDIVLLIESRKRGSHLRYHKRKLVLIYSAMRHFARELEEAGWRVDYHRLADTADFLEAWQRHARKFDPGEVWMMEPNSLPEQNAAESIARRIDRPLRFFPTCQFLVPREDFAAFARGKKRLLMENHYRAARKRFRILVDEAGEPEGGAWNFDSENRRTVADWRKDGAPPPPAPDAFAPDAITREAMADVARFFPDAPGSVEGFALAVTRHAARAGLRTFITERLVRFGDYQDLMLEASPGLFHSWTSASINIGLLDPAEAMAAAVDAYWERRAPLSAVEGFVRQILGWREFVNGVYWLKMPAYAASNALEARRSLPAFFYTADTDLHCLHRTLSETRETAYNHHIQRLMILGNFLLLAGIDPQQALRWFTEMYVDAFDWVMAANVLGMALHADGGFMATKPYAGSGAYIDRMSDYCKSCRYSPKIKSGPGACPFNLLYWTFYDRHASRFASNPRTAVMIKSWQKRPAAEREAILREAGAFLEALAE